MRCRLAYTCGMERWVRCTGGLAAVAFTASAFATTGVISDPIVKAIRHGDCAKAVEQMKSEVGSSSQNQTAIFVAARMLDEGVCVNKAADAATQLYARGAELGDRDARLDYATKVGLGEGTSQDYLHAGDLCHQAGVDPQGHLSFYALGYACTVRGLAGRMLRESLPRGAFRVPTDPVMVEFRPRTSELRILSTPKAERAESRTGSMFGAPLVNPQEAVEKAWHEALATVPKPDPASLGDGAVELGVDIDMSIEAGRDAPKGDLGQFMQGDLAPVQPRAH
jgi:hypothetical protein